jgi:nitrile hydratase subunit beta
MNGVHDVGGMQDFGPIRPEANEPVFHAPWEGRVLAMNLAMAAWGKTATDSRRYARELIPPAQQLAMSYYEKWFAGLIKNIVDVDLVSRTEVESGIPTRGSPKFAPPLPATRVAVFWSNGSPKSRNVPAIERFRVGQRVRTRNINPLTHTRLPRYARDKFGIVERARGVFVFPDSNAEGLGEKPQHLYSVRFTARDLWGDQGGAKDSVYIDMWDEYLEPV